MIAISIFSFLSFLPLYSSGGDLPLSVSGSIHSSSEIRKNQNSDIIFKNVFGANLQFQFRNNVLPFSWTISDRKNTFTHPFNQFVISPNWGKFRFQIGHINSFGVPFLGNSIEYKSNVQTIQLFGGRINKAIRSTLNDPAINPAYERWTTGIGYSINSRSVGLKILFSYTSDLSNPDFKFGNEAPVSPKKNLNINLEAKLKINELLSIQVMEKSNLTDSVGQNDRFILPDFIDPQFEFSHKYALLFSGKRIQSSFSYEKTTIDFHELNQWHNNADQLVIGYNFSFKSKSKKWTFKNSIGIQQQYSDSRNFRSTFKFQIGHAQNQNRISFSASNISTIQGVQWFDYLLLNRQQGDSLQVFKSRNTIDFQLSKQKNRKSGKWMFDFRSQFSNGIYSFYTTQLNEIDRQKSSYNLSGTVNLQFQVKESFSLSYLMKSNYILGTANNSSNYLSQLGITKNINKLSSFNLSGGLIYGSMLSPLLSLTVNSKVPVKLKANNLPQFSLSSMFRKSKKSGLDFSVMINLSIPF